MHNNLIRKNLNNLYKKKKNSANKKTNTNEQPSGQKQRKRRTHTTTRKHLKLIFNFVQFSPKQFSTKHGLQSTWQAIPHRNNSDKK